MNLIYTVQCTVNNENQKIMNLDPSKKSQQAWDTAIVQCKQTYSDKCLVKLFAL